MRTSDLCKKGILKMLFTTSPVLSFFSIPSSFFLSFLSWEVTTQIVTQNVVSHITQLEHSAMETSA